jgi:DNA-binding NtrC family response regulator
MAAPANPNGRLILVVDDEPFVVRSITATLAMAGFRVMVAEHGAAGLDAFLSHADEIKLVLADVLMPMMDGIKMAQQIKLARPDARILMMSAYSVAVVNAINEARFPFMRKPFLPQDLVRAVEASLHPPAACA